MTRPARDKGHGGLWSRTFVLLSLTLLVCIMPTSLSDAQEPVLGWTAPQDIAAPITDGDDLFGVLICDPNQNLHILWGKSHDGGSEIYYRTDGGGDLSDPKDVLALSHPLAIRLSAEVTTPDLTLHVIWQNNYIRGALVYSNAPLARASDLRAWSRPRQLVDQVDSAGLVADPAGAIHMIYGSSDSDGRTNTVYHMQSVDSGLTWSEPAPLYAVSSEEPSTISPLAAIDQRGRIHVGITIRSQEYGVYSEVGYIQSPDGGQTWQPYRVVAEQNEQTPNVSVVAPFVFGDDEVHLTWHDPRRMHMWSDDGGATWSNPIQIIEQGAGFGGANYLAKDTAGVLRAATGVKNGVYVSTFAGSQWLAPEQIENRSMDPHGQQLVVCQGNQLHVVYDDRVVEDTTVWYSHRQVDAPHIAQSPLPETNQTVAIAASAEDTADASSTPEPEQTVAASKQSIDRGAPATPAADSTTPLLISTASVIVLLVAVFFLARTRRG